MSREVLLAARIRQLERRPEDVEQAKAKLREARMKNKERFDWMHRLRPGKIEKGDWVLVYDNSLNNQHRSSRKFARRWLGPYVVTSANDNATYHLAELDGSRLVVPIAEKRQDEDPDLDHLDDEHNRADVNEDMEESD